MRLIHDVVHRPQECPVQECSPSHWTRETFRLQTPGQGRQQCLASGGTQIFSGVLFPCLEGESWVLEDTCSESSGAGRMSVLGSHLGSSFPCPRSPSSLPSCLPPRARILWKLQESLALYASPCHKSISVQCSPRAITISFLQPGGSLRTRPSQPPSLGSQGLDITCVLRAGSVWPGSAHLCLGQP